MDSSQPLSAGEAHHPIVADVNQTGCGSQQHQGQNCAEQDSQQFESGRYLRVRDAQAIKISQGWRLGLDGCNINTPFSGEELYLCICRFPQDNVCWRPLGQSLGAMAVGCFDDASQRPLQRILILMPAPEVDRADAAGSQ